MEPVIYELNFILKAQINTNRFLEVPYSENTSEAMS